MTIIRRGNSWGVKTWDPGQRRYRWVGTFSSEPEAQAAEASEAPLGSARTVKAWCAVWLSDYARPAPATQASYRYAVRRIITDLGERGLSSITRPEAVRIANAWPAYIRTVAAVVWADAVREGLCELNPWANMRFRKSKGRRRLKALTTDEIMELADLTLETHEYYGQEFRAIVLTLGVTGVRPGELFALRWSDLDLANGQLRVERGVNALGEEGPTKNREPRTIIVPDVALDAICRLPEPIDRGRRLFLSPRGRPLNKSNFKYVWRPLATLWHARHGRRLQPYELRHACATMLVEAGLAPADVAHQLGHQDGGMLVSTTYGHPAEKAIRERIKLATSHLRTQQRSQPEKATA